MSCSAAKSVGWPYNDFKGPGWKQLKAAEELEHYLDSVINTKTIKHEKTINYRDSLTRYELHTSTKCSIKA